MNIYAAAVYTSNLFQHGPMFNRLDPREQQARLALRYTLESYHYVHKKSMVDRMRTDKVKVFLDSGAFSAFMLGAEIDIDGYGEYIKTNKDLIEHYSVLDGIGDPQKTWENQEYLERFGLRPIPCFHYGEDERYLEYYIKHYDYISLGGMVPISTPQLILWLDRIWHEYLVGADRRPVVRVHGFGLTRLQLLYRYPWYSVDSTSWQQAGSAGRLILPVGKTVAVSDVSPTRKQAGQHVDNVSTMERDVIWQFVTSRGFDPARMQRTYLARWCYNLNSLSEINDLLDKREQAGLNVFTNEQIHLFP